MTDQRADADADAGLNSDGPDADAGNGAEDSRRLRVPVEPNTRPGPTDQGGHGGMATREQEARELRKQSSEESDGE